MTIGKRKISVSLDPEIVAELEAEGGNLSNQINQTLRDEIGRRRRNRLLTELLDSMDARFGKVDEKLVAKYESLLE